MIPDFKTFIGESVWGGMLDRSIGDTVRKEDAFNPEYIDFGENTTVYWAVENLQIDGDSRFTFYKVQNYNNNGWRLPTIEEVNQIDWSVATKWWSGGHWNISPVKDHILKLFSGTGVSLYMWTCEENKAFTSAAYAYGFYDAHEYSLKDFNKNCKLFVLLVKDKNYINESVWGGMLDRSVGDTVRKEDSILNNMNPGEFVDYLSTIYRTTYNYDDINFNDDYVSIPVFEFHTINGGNYSNLHIQGFGGEKSIDLSLKEIDKFRKKYNPFLQKIMDTFSVNIETSKNNWNWSKIDIKPKDGGKITNKFYIEVLDFLIDLLNEKEAKGLEKLIERI